MTTIVEEGRLRFTFPDNWAVLKYDECRFYTQHFQKLAQSKAVDIIAFDPSAEEIWFIEIKDYAQGQRNKDISLYDEVAFKVRDTLAGLATLKHRDNLPEEQVFAQQAIDKPKQRVVFHLELPKNRSRTDSKSLYPPVKEKTNATEKLQTVMRAVDTKAIMCNVQTQTCQWQVERV